MSFKKKVFTGIMLSTVTLSALAPITPFINSTVAHAETTEDKIAGADATIEDNKAKSAEAKAALDTVQASFDATNARVKQLEDESKTTSAAIKKLGETIKERDKTLKTQARSAQTNGTITSYINTVLNAKSLTDVVQKVTAMSQVVQASNDMMQQQKKDKAELETKLAENTKRYDEATQLQQQQSVQVHDLAAARALYDSTVASTQEERDSLVAQQQAEIAAAQKVAADQKAAEEAAAAKKAAEQQSAAAASTAGSQGSAGDANSSGNASSSGSSASYTNTGGSTAGNPYPVGQCTWGVYEILGGNMPIFQGNAGDWAVNANTSTPAPGEIMVFSPAAAGNGLGHVAVIDSVNADGTVNIREANYNGNSNVTSRSNVSTIGCSFIAV
ncbi:CHAP domain-containing protein [Lactovum odontotermitis]